ncbi:hypothetical protein [Methylomonas sp. 11b]|uniref:hypothetical protein n=1 Tax=Methylomonas sp. 11b TaxID=1168169 RepID=UPI00047EBB84|nr:hypothetical protein [Methylomonas sp. 11b]
MIILTLLFGLLLLKVSLNATVYLMSVLGPTAEILSFASPIESIQRKGDPDAAYSLRSSLLVGVAERGFLPLRQRDASVHRPCGLFPPKAPVLGAAYGIPTVSIATVTYLVLLVFLVWSNVGSACKSLYYPPTFPLEKLKAYDQVYVINVDTVNYSKPLSDSWYAPNFDFEGRIVEVLKGAGKPGDVVQGATDSTEQANARCPVFLEAGITYLLFLLGDRSPYVLPRFGSLYTPSSDSYDSSTAALFRHYVTEIRRAQKRRHKKQ